MPSKKSASPTEVPASIVSSLGPQQAPSPFGINLAPYSRILATESFRSSMIDDILQLAYVAGQKEGASLANYLNLTDLKYLEFLAGDNFPQVLLSLIQKFTYGAQGLTFGGARKGLKGYKPSSYYLTGVEGPYRTPVE